MPSGLEELPSRVLSPEGGGILPTDPRDPEGKKMLQRWFQVDLECPEGLADEFLGTRAYVRFEHPGEPLAQQMWRRIRQLFLARFDV